jgi:hypothetical protein
MCKDCNENPLLVRHWRDQQDAWLRDTVRKHGWAIQYVFGENEQSPSLAYTVGMTGFGRPEFVLFGLGQKSAAMVLNALGERARAGERFRDGDVVGIGSGRVMLFELPNPAEVLFGANSFYGRSAAASVAGLYAVYPDQHDVWPWEPGYDLPAFLQPMPGLFRA